LKAGYTRKITKYPARYPIKVRFSRSVVVGNYVFVSGCSGQTLETFHADSDDVEAQTEVALDKVRAAIEEAGSSMENLVKVIVYLTSAEDRRRVESRIDDYYYKYAPRLIKEPPAETVVCVAGLHEADLLVEIDSIALIPNSEGQDACS
jgi:enamine deaminase RidA (YjgF/YER057c/UK114 family)